MVRAPTSHFGIINLFLANRLCSRLQRKAPTGTEIRVLGRRADQGARAQTPQFARTFNNQDARHCWVVLYISSSRRAEFAIENGEDSSARRQSSSGGRGLVIIWSSAAAQCSIGSSSASVL